MRLVNYTDVYYNQRITADLDLMEATASTDHIERFGVRPGDLIITKDSEYFSDDIGIPALVDFDSRRHGVRLPPVAPAALHRSG